jgi:hypothetical protein
MARVVAAFRVVQRDLHELGERDPPTVAQPASQAPLDGGVAWRDLPIVKL